MLGWQAVLSKLVVQTLSDFVIIFIYAFFIEGNKLQWLALLSKQALIFKTMLDGFSIVL